MDNASECTGHGPCTGWQWCGWCGGQPGGCEFCEGAGKRGCPTVVDDIDGNRWEHTTTTARDMWCVLCGNRIDPGQPVLRRVGSPDVIADFCVSPKYGPPPGR
ncbi:MULTISPECIES: hypothetical protein [unclassified Micromonospora]|uniref:hypothetical protein n=1 Tax=unclassified Micromonospora TaxID=2617518 RepID=UPI003316C866